MKVLVIDDDPMTLQLTSHFVTALGHELLFAADGFAGWALYQEYAPEVILSDWIMPVLSGPELCQRVRKCPGPGYTYFILLTSRTERSDLLTGMRAGADDYLTKPLDREQLQVRLLSAERVTGLHRELAAQRAALEQLNERLFKEGRMDPLTGLGNRLRLREDLSTMSARIERHDARCCLALSDVDHFKKYNDTCGHLAGDEVLRKVAATLLSQCRASDTAYRFGGEEFLVMMPDTAPEQGRLGAERWRQALLRQAIPHPGLAQPGLVSVSIGVAALGFPLHIDEALRQADEALYQAKAAGRNRVVLYQPAP